MTPQVWTNEFLDQKRQKGDPFADQLLDQMIEEKGIEEARRIFDLLIRDIDLPLEAFPETIQAFLASTSELPKWTDWDKIELAHQFFLDHGAKFLIFLYFKSLPLLYCCKNGAEVLVRTSRLTNKEENFKIFTRRIAETGQFIVDVMTPGQLQKGGKGVQTIQKVRLVHAAIRKFVGQKNWDTEQLGVPVNQEDLILTLLSFSISSIDALQQFRVEEEETQKEAYLHAWMSIGVVLGIDEDLLPSNLEQARGLIEQILQRQAASSESGQILTRALIQFSEAIIPKTFFDNAPSVLIRHLIGRERAEMLDIYPAPGCLGYLFPTFLRNYFRLGERLEDRIKGPLDLVLNQLAQKSVSLMVGYFDHYKQRHFELPKVLKKAWLE